MHAAINLSLNIAARKWDAVAAEKMLRDVSLLINNLTFFRSYDNLG